MKYHLVVTDVRLLHGCYHVEGENDLAVAVDSSTGMVPEEGDVIIIHTNGSLIKGVQRRERLLLYKLGDVVADVNLN